jgi:hypothetical protein
MAWLWTPTPLATTLQVNGAEIIDEAVTRARKAEVPFEQQVVESFKRSPVSL